LKVRFTSHQLAKGKLSKMNKKAFTLVEVLVAVGVIAIGFAGVYALVSASNNLMYETFEKEKLNYEASNIVESLHHDKANILSYHNQDISNCTAIKVTPGKNENQLKNLKKWCEKIAGEVGAKNTTREKRLIKVQKKQANGKELYVITVELSGKKNDKNKTIYLKRAINVD